MAQESDRQILERIDGRLDRIERDITLLVEVVKLHSIRFDTIEKRLQRIEGAMQIST